MAKLLVDSIICNLSLQQLRARLQRLENLWGSGGWLASSGERLVMGEYPFARMVYKNLTGDIEHSRFTGMLDYDEQNPIERSHQHQPQTRTTWIVHYWRSTSMRPEYHPTRGLYQAAIEAYEEGHGRTRVDFLDGYNPKDPKRESLRIGAAFEKFAVAVKSELLDDVILEMGKKTETKINFRELRQLIFNHFDLDELRLLAIDTDIPWDDIVSEKKSVTIHSLISYMERRGRLEDLIQLLRVERPNVNWDGVATREDEGAITKPTRVSAQYRNESDTGQYHSCFICYSSKDSEFAERLYGDLTEAGVSCWFAPKDIQIGANLRTTLDTAVRAHNKLLLILSHNSVASSWIEQEVETAFEKERESGKPVLFPIRIDDAVFKIRTGWAAHIQRTRYIGDFCSLDLQDYQAALRRVLRDLQITEHTA